MGSLGLNKQFYKSIPVLANISSDSYIFLGGSNNTIQTFFNSSELTANTLAASADQILINEGSGFITYYYFSIAQGWYRQSPLQSANTKIIANNSLVAFKSPSSKTLTMQGTNLIQKYSNLGTTSIKKQNQTILKPYSIDGGATAYDANAVYIFKGGTTNTISTVFNYLELTGGNTFTADFIIINSDIYYYKTSGIGGTGWRNTLSASSDASNTVINLNDIISFAPRSYKEINIGSGVIVQKLYSGKLNIN